MCSCRSSAPTSSSTRSSSPKAAAFPGGSCCGDGSSVAERATVPVPFPPPETTKVALPDAREVELLARGVATVAAGSTGLTEIQRLLIEAIFPAITHHHVAVAPFAPLDPGGLALALAERDEAFRTRILQIAILCSLVLRPLPGE